MSRPGLSPVDLSQLPPPSVVETLDYEAIVCAIRDDFVERFPLIETVIDLESEPSRKLIEVFAYRELGLRARINDSARAVMVAFATGSNLDHLAADVGVERLVIREAEDGQLAVMESDARLRRRVQLAPEAFNTAGSEGAYVYHALTAAPTIADASAVTPVQATGEVVVTLLGAETPQPTDAELARVRGRLAQKDVRPLTDIVSVQGPDARRPALVARLTIYPGPAAGPILTAAKAKITAFLAQNRRLGLNLSLSALIAALHVEGVQSVEIVSPTVSIEVDETGVVDPISVTVTIVGRDE